MLFHVLVAIAEFERDLALSECLTVLPLQGTRRGGKLPPQGLSISPDKLAVAPAVVRAWRHAREADR
jgi:hypothetical protein